MTLLTLDLFHIHALSAINIIGPEKEILTDIQNSLREDTQEESVAKAAQELQKDPTRSTIHSAEWSKVQGLLMFRGKVYVLNDRELRRRIVEQHHDSHVAGHAGRFKTLELVARNYWWPQMSRYIGLYVKTCDLYNRTKLQHCHPSGELHASETPKE